MYRSTWVCFVGLAGTAGLCASVQALSLAGILTLFLIIGIGMACIGLAVAKEGDRSPWRRAAELGIAGGAAVVAAAGLVAWLGIVGLVVVTVLVILSPTVLTAAVGRYRVRRHGRAGLTGHGPDSGSDRAAAGRDHHTGARGEASSATEASLLQAPWLEGPLDSMDDPTLCLAWRTSYVALQRPLALPLRLRIVDRRQQFLDELERRHPDGFSAWLASGARAAGDPSRYISQVQRRADRGDQREAGA